MPMQSHPAHGDRADLFFFAHCRPRLRRQSALLAQTRRIFHSRSAHGMDRQNRLQSHGLAVSSLIDDVSLCLSNSFDLFPLLSVAATAAPPRSLGLQETPPAPAP